ncbi:DUF420 domain-containing protein [Zhouia sp. PK063]|uniref:DUF420 domain-containing protein n=1 Tax=Zhouia sp. PK063 TaxID=3373602 RepID=UPI00378E5980
MEEKTLQEKKYNRWIVVLSIVIPVAVAVLYSVKLEDFGIKVAPFTFLPPIYATINGLTAVLLIAALIQIKKGNVQTHKKLMQFCIGLSVAFLVMYVAYHMTSDPAHYGGNVKFLYFFILITHVLLSIIIIPLVLISYVRALAERFDKHRKIAKITFPIWLYVAITGVIVYLMISPYYGA